VKKDVKKKYENKLVVKANKIIEASFRLSLQEQRIILYMASHIKPEDEQFNPIILPLNEFADMMDLNDPSYAYMEQVTKELLQKVLTIKQNNGVLQIGWLSSARYLHNVGYVELRFDPNLKPYLLQLKERFTKLKLLDAIQFTHSYSIRFYELLKQYESIGWRYFDLKDLKWILGITEKEYKLYGDFKARVLNPVKEEFDEKFNKGELNFTFTYEEEKRSRQVVGIRFALIKNESMIQQDKPEASEALRGEVSEAFRGEAKKCWNSCHGNCQAKWSAYKDNKFIACHYCVKFAQQRLTI
jgi:plasmid replication initiation protein